MSFLATQKLLQEEALHPINEAEVQTLLLPCPTCIKQMIRPSEWNMQKICCKESFLNSNASRISLSYSEIKWRKAYSARWLSSVIRSLIRILHTGSTVLLSPHTKSASTPYLEAIACLLAYAHHVWCFTFTITFGTKPIWRFGQDWPLVGSTWRDSPPSFFPLSSKLSWCNCSKWKGIVRAWNQAQRSEFNAQCKLVALDL